MRTTTLAGVLVVLSLAVAACGGDDDAGDATDVTSPPISEPDVSEPDAAEPATTEPATTEPDVTEPAPGAAAPDDAVPSAIVSLSPSATEMLFAIGAGDQVLAVDTLSTYPPETADKQAGLSAFEPSVEAIADLEPDLVVTDGTNTDLLEQLDTLGIAHWEGPAATSFDDVHTQIEQLGAVTGHVADAAELVGGMQTDIEAIKAGLPDFDAPLTYYHELDETYYSVTSDTFIGAVYDEVGLRNIADAAGDGTPYPQLNAEFIIDADPDLIFLACSKYCGTTAESVAERPGWGDLTAVRTGSLIEVDDDVASRWGPRIVDYLEQVAAAVDAAVATV
jgi:iron complex transport system substrate-binding protein